MARLRRPSAAPAHRQAGRRSWPRLRLPGLVLALTSLLLAGLPAPTASTQGAAQTGVQVTITDSGFQPQLATVTAGQSVHWTNQSSQARIVVHAGGLLDSGSLAPEAGYSLTIATAGDYAYTSAGGLSGTLRVTTTTGGISGPPNDKVADYLPDLAFGGSPLGETGAHPLFEGRTSRTRLLVSFRQTATVAEANAALSAAGVTVIGGLPALGLVLVAAPDTADFSGLMAAQRALLANSAVELAALVPETQTKALPWPHRQDVATDDKTSVKVRFRVAAEDRFEPGSGQDTFEITVWPANAPANAPGVTEGGLIRFGDVSIKPV